MDNIYFEHIIENLEKLLPQIINIVTPEYYAMMVEEFNDFRAGMYGDDIGILQALIEECNSILSRNTSKNEQIKLMNYAPLTEEEKIVLDNAGLTE